MRVLLIALLPAAVAFAAAEIVCRAVLHLSDETVPLIVFPITFIVWGLTTALLKRREADAPKAD